MNPFHFLKSFRKSEPEAESAASIRRRRHDVHEQRRITIQQRDLLAFDALNDQAVSIRWSTLDATIGELDRQIAVLDAALPTAEARESEAAETAEADRRAELMLRYERRTTEVRVWLDGLIQRLPSAEQLTAARDLRDELSAIAAQMRGWSDDTTVRRPFDPLQSLHTAMDYRCERIQRSRWFKSPHAITLDARGTEGAITAAVSRVVAMEGTDQ